MLKRLLNFHRRRGPVKYAALAAAVAVVSILALEAAGTSLTSSYSGLGGKLESGPARAVAPVAEPVR